MYVDNVGVVSAEKGQATEAMDGVCQVMEGQKLMMHERGLFEDEVPGAQLDPRRWRRGPQRRDGGDLTEPHVGAHGTGHCQDASSIACWATPRSTPC